jgi:hypothetical protein
VPHDAERDTYLVLDDFGDRIGCTWSETDAENIDRATLVRGTSNEDGVSMSDNTLNKALRIMAARRRRAQLPRDRVDLAQRGGTFDGDAVETQLGHNTERKSADGATRGAASLVRATRTRSVASMTARPIGPNACVY